MSATLQDLIARLEKATGHDRQLNADIAFAMGLYKRPPVVATPPDYTASIDSALTLVPEGCVWALNFASMATIIRPGKCGVLDGEELGQWPEDQDEAERRVTPAIALCIAALKARGI